MTSIFGGSQTVNVNVNGTLVPQSFTATAGQTVFNITNFSYTQNTNSLLVFINGDKQSSGKDFAETSSTSFTLTEACLGGETVEVIGFPQIDLTAVNAGAVNVGGTYSLTQYLNDSVINVKAYPYLAKGDGVTDDTAAIQAAITVANLTSRAVYIPAGKYNISASLVAPEFISLRGETGNSIGGDNSPTSEQNGTVLNWIGADATSVILVDLYTTKYASYTGFVIHVPTSYSGKVVHQKGSRFVTQGGCYSSHLDTIAVYRKGAINPQATTAVAFYWDATNTVAADGQAFFGGTAKNLFAFNTQDFIKVEILDNTVGAPRDNWFNGNIIETCNCYQTYRVLNLIAGTGTNSINANTFRDIFGQTGVGTDGVTKAVESVTGSGVTVGNYFSNVVVFDVAQSSISPYLLSKNSFIGCGYNTNYRYEFVTVGPDEDGIHVKGIGIGTGERNGLILSNLNGRLGFVGVNGGQYTGTAGAANSVVIQAYSTKIENIIGTSVGTVLEDPVYRPRQDNYLDLGTQANRWATAYTYNINTKAVLVSTLPSPVTLGAGTRAFVTDATVTTFASIVAGGGSNKVPVYSDGTNWRIG